MGSNIPTVKISRKFLYTKENWTQMKKYNYK